MACLNLLNLGYQPRTHEGAPARHLPPELQLRRSVLACLLWESQFYEDGIEIAGRIAELVPKVEAEKVAAMAVEAREQGVKVRAGCILQMQHGRAVGGTQIVEAAVAEDAPVVDHDDAAAQRLDVVHRPAPAFRSP